MTPSWALSLDDYTDESDSDCEMQAPVQTVTQEVTAPPVKPLPFPLDEFIDASESDADSDAEKFHSPRSQDLSTCDPDSDALSIGSDSEDASQPAATLVVVEDATCFAVASLLKLRHSVSWLEGIEDRQVTAVEHVDAYKMEAESKAPKASTSKSKRARKSAKKNKEGTKETTVTSFTTDKVEVSEDSWMAQQVARRNSSQSSDDEIVNESDVMRTVRSILNKLTIEKFATLFQKLITCGIKRKAHVSALMTEVFEKAAMQHHFINMYADMCVRLCSHFGDCPVVDEPHMNFECVLMESYEAFSSTYLSLPADFESLDEEDRLMMERKMKMQKLGVMKFLGALLVRHMLNAKIFFDTCQSLLVQASPESLELLAALLTMVGPHWDSSEWSEFAKLSAVFAKVQEIVKTPGVNRRACFLLKDLLELRSAGWRDLKPKLAEAPSTLKKVAEAQAAEQKVKSPPQPRSQDRMSRLQSICQRKNSSEVSSRTSSKQESPSLVRLTKICQSKSCSSPKPLEQQVPSRDVDLCYSGRNCRWSGCQYSHPHGRLVDEVDAVPLPKQAPASPPAKKSSEQEGSIVQQVGKVKKRFRKNTCRKEITEILEQLRDSRDMHKAAVRIASMAVPASKQGEEFSFMLTLMIQEACSHARKTFFEMAASLFTEGIWMQSALTTGLETVLDSGCSELEQKVPNLSKIMWEELHPVIAPQVSQAIAK